MCAQRSLLAAVDSAEGVAATAAAPARPRLSRIRELARTLRGAWLQVFGIPDYERYLAHRAAHHPGEPVLSRRRFATQAIERKYSGNGPRCC